MGMMQKPYADIVTHQRATASSRWNEFGQFEVVPANQPCIDHDPASLGTSTSAVAIGLGQAVFATTAVYAVGDVVQASVSSGVFVRGRVKSSVAGSLTLEVAAVGGSGTYSNWTLIRVRGLGVWEQRTNLIENSNFLLAGAWQKSGSRLSQNSAIGPDGIASAWEITSDGSSTLSYITNRISVAAGVSYMFRFVLKAGTTPIVIFEIGAATWGRSGFTLDLTSGQVTAGNSTGASILKRDDGWVEITITMTAVSPNAISGVTLYYGSYGGAVPGRSIFFWCYEAQQGSFPTPPHPDSRRLHISRHYRDLLRSEWRVADRRGERGSG